MEISKPGRTVRLPYPIGETVYLDGREDRVPGKIVAFNAFPGMLKATVQWSDNPYNSADHFLFELTTEYEPRYPAGLRD
jgi:hypothetical protein